MKKKGKYVIVFGIIGVLLAIIFGPTIILNFFIECYKGPCLSDTMTYRMQALPFGLIIGAFVGLIVARFKK